MDAFTDVVSEEGDKYRLLITGWSSVIERVDERAIAPRFCGNVQAGSNCALNCLRLAVAYTELKQFD